MIKIDLRDKHDARARELGFSDRKELRAAMNSIADSMSWEDFDALTEEDMETRLRKIASEVNK